MPNTARIKRKREAVNVFELAKAFGDGDFPTGINNLRSVSHNNKRAIAAVMKSRNRRVRRTKRRRGRRSRMPAALKPMRLPVKRIVMYESTSGSKHRWYYVIPLSLLTASFTSTFQEFKVISMTVTYTPNNSLSETGLYASIMLDREGFGSFGSATATSWFSYLGNMPGSVIKPRHAPSTHRWKPTEPSVRDWFNKDQVANVHLATIYICNNGKEDVELGGLLNIKAVLLARGRYWNAAIADPNPIRLQPAIIPGFTEQAGPCPREDEFVTLDAPRSNASSHSSIVEGVASL